MRLEIRLSDATQAKALRTLFQPLLHAETRKLAGLEALLRLPSGPGDYISPATFVPVAEPMGPINEIGAWALSEAT